MTIPLPIPLQMAVIPKEITARIIQIARSYFETSDNPRFVDVVPLEFCSAQNCHRNVEQAVQQFGGIQQFGWAVNHVPGEYYEFVAHSVWVRHDHSWVDITPEPGTQRRLIVPDNSVRYDGTRPIPTRFFPDRASARSSQTVERMNTLAERISLCVAAADECKCNLAHSELSRLVVTCIQRSAQRGWKS